MSASSLALRGAACWFVGDPFAEPTPSALHFESDAMVLIEGGRIAAIGAASQITNQIQSHTPVHAYPNRVLLPGFIDAHVHYAQLPIIGASGHQLLEWLEQYTFPSEREFNDVHYARRVAQQFCRELLRNGTTSALVFGTVHEQSVDALFESAAPFGMQLFAGKALMDRLAPEGLMDTAQSGYDQSKRLIERWHGKGRLGYAVTPRFAVTSTPEQLHSAGALWREQRGTLLQSHLAENEAEIAWVRKVFPERRDYVDVFEHFELLGPGAIYGHGIHLSARERQALADSRTAIAHCPTSNLFLGSGLFDLQAMLAATPAVPVALATDVGAGTSLSMLHTMSTAYQVAQLRGFSLSPSHLLWLATGGSAAALGWQRDVGNLTPGMYADIVVLDPHATSLSSLRAKRTEGFDDLLGAMITLGDDRLIEATYVAGQRVWHRSSGFSSVAEAQ